MLDSGLRGRGGAGFPTGLKWRFASGERGQVQKYVCCNADEGDPGAFMDRSVLEGDPFSVIEAMTIGSVAVGYLTESMHGAGSPQAQRIMIGRQANMEAKKALARRLCGIDPDGLF